MIHIRVPATSANLGPGFDTLGMALNLWLEVKWRPGPTTRITVLGEGAGDLPNDSRNLIYQIAVETLARLSDGTPPPGHLEVKNGIPVERGLGSSASATIAGVLLGAHWAEQTMDAQHCLDLATPYEGHLDNVAPAVMGGVTLAWNDGSKSSFRRLDPPPFPIVLAIPDFKVSTRRARSILPSWVAREDAVFNAQRVGLWVYALARGEWDLLRTASEDRLHQNARSPLIPGLRSVLQAALHHGAKLATLSGSGSTVLAMAEADSLLAVGEAMGEVFRTYGVQARIVVTQVSHKGAEVVLSQPAHA